MQTWLTMLDCDKLNETLENKAFPREWLGGVICWNLREAVVQRLNAVDAGIFDVAGSESLEPVVLDFAFACSGDGFERHPRIQPLRKK